MTTEQLAALQAAALRRLQEFVNRSAAAQGRVAQRRASMPVVAAFVDMCRRAYGPEMVDRQMAIAQQARREHAHVEATQGRGAAEAWLKANAHRCTFFAQEQGRTLGLQSPYGRNVETATSQV